MRVLVAVAAAHLDAVIDELTDRGNGSPRSYATRLRAADNARARRELGFAPRPFSTPTEL